ncbi:MAG TPA: hypothetical protein PKZ83_02540 [bacterium]|nr:hypothetical protein [bacterium]HQJ63263.1 hypothetical protein [bacterium]
MLLACWPVQAQVTGKIERMTLLEKDLLFLGEGRRGPYFLPDTLILAQSERVFLDNKPLSRDHYTLNYLKGEIRFADPVPQGAAIRLQYKIFPSPLARVRQRHPLVQRMFGATSPGESLPREMGSEEIDYAAQLNKNGSITRGITVGSNRGLKVNSSLNINVSGKVAENVEVVAALTDQSTPIQPEGTTQNLQEIDKVFVQINAPHLSAIMGDYTLDFTGAEFAQYSRKLQGAMGSVRYQNLQLSASGAVSRGKYFSYAFTGQEGNQGPYQLVGDRGQIDMIVMAGTERVYLDGQTLVRGETNDYIIDYAAAQITFTRRRLITADSRIVVDFQFSDEQYRRSIYAAQASGTLWNGRLKLGSALIREGDDKDNPLDFTLDDQKLAILRAAGDNASLAAEDGATYVGQGKGRYRKAAAGYYVYAGADSGDYSVIFSDVSEGKGAYKYTGAGAYAYVGAGLGRYQPVQLLVTPESHTLMDFQLAAAPNRTWRLNGEIAVSNLDRNTFSSLGDGDNQGAAQSWQIAFTPDTLRFLKRHLGVLQWSGRYRRVEDRFSDIDRTQEAEYNRRWDLGRSAARGEKVWEMSGDWAPFTGARLSGEYGDNHKSGGFQSQRWQLEHALDRPSLPSYALRVEHITRAEGFGGSRSEWLRARGQAHYSLWRFRPLVEYEGEEKKENWSASMATGFRFNALTGGTEIRPSRKISAQALYSWRDDQTYAGGNAFIGRSTARTQQVKLRAQQLGALSGSLEFTHRERTYADSAISKKNTDLAEIRLLAVPWKSAVNADVNYQISNTATARKERIYIKVNPGDGTYRYDKDLNEYVLDPLGDYIVRILTTDDLVPVVELKSSARLRLDPARFWSRSKGVNPLTKWKRWLSALSSETYGAIEERTQEKNVWQIYLMELDKFQRPEVTLFGAMQWRQDLFLFENRRDLSLRLRYQQKNEMNNQYLEGGQERGDREVSARLTGRMGNRLYGQSDLMRKWIKRSFTEHSRQDRDILSNQGRLELSYRPRPTLELALEGRYAREADRSYLPETRVHYLALTPRATYSWRTNGRLQAELEWNQVGVAPQGRIIPYEMADGRSAGRSMRWDMRFEYRLSQTIQASVSYTGRNEPARQGVTHTGRAQVTAAFR